MTRRRPADARDRHGPRIDRWRCTGLALLACMAGALAGCHGPPADVIELSGPTMGTRYSIALYPAPAAETRALVAEQVRQRLDAVNALMSTYDPDSTLSRFNRSRSTDWQPVPGALRALVARALAISDQTGGVYDVTVGPLVALWGFGADGRRDRPPPADAIAQTLQSVGYGKLAVRRDPPALRKRHPSLQVDLSSIAKGWAVDELAALLERHGISNYLVEIGGDLRARGNKGPGGPWRIAIEQPLADRRAVQRLVAVRDLALATSGDYRNFFDADGRRYTHTIDPRTGRSVRHRLAAVTVFADNCRDADAWATALLALGERDGPETAGRLGIRALFIVRDGATLREVHSPALQASQILDD